MVTHLPSTVRNDSLRSTGDKKQWKKTKTRNRESPRRTRNTFRSRGAGRTSVSLINDLYTGTSPTTPTSVQTSRRVPTDHPPEVPLTPPKGGFGPRGRPGERSRPGTRTRPLCHEGRPSLNPLSPSTLGLGSPLTRLSTKERFIPSDRNLQSDSCIPNGPTFYVGPLPTPFYCKIFRVTYGTPPTYAPPLGLGSGPLVPTIPPLSSDQARLNPHTLLHPTFPTTTHVPLSVNVCGLSKMEGLQSEPLT